MTTLKVPSKDEWKENSGGEFLPLPPDNYIAYIHKIDPNVKQQSYDSVKKRGRVEDIETLPEDEVQTMHNVELLVYGLKSRDPLKDNEGNNISPMSRRAWKSINPLGVGYQPNGAPSHLRAFLAYATSGDLDGNLEVDLKDLLGKFIGIDLDLNSKGKNAVTKFSKVPESFEPDMNIVKQALLDIEERAKKKEDDKDQADKSFSSSDFGSSDADTNDVSIDDVPF